MEPPQAEAVDVTVPRRAWRAVGWGGVGRTTVLMLAWLASREHPVGHFEMQNRTILGPIQQGSSHVLVVSHFSGLLLTILKRGAYWRKSVRVKDDKK